MRFRQYLAQRYRAILSYTGAIWIIIGLLIVAPLLALPFYPQEWPVAWGYLLPGMGLVIVGAGLWRWLTPRDPISLTGQEGTVIVVLTWGTAILVGALPFVLIEGLTVTQAIFESTSGWTTTGLSVVDVTAVSPITLLYRSTMQLAGGAGFAIIMLTALTGPLGSGLSSAEGRSEQLEPHVRRSATIVLRIYTGYVIVGAVALVIAGMGWFDAVNHAFAALSTGGFSTQVASIGHWDSALVEAAVMVLMLLGTTNFLASYALLRGKWRNVMQTSEMRFLVVIVMLASAVLLFGVTMGAYPTLAKSTRVAIFEALTAISTTGFSTVGYGNWHRLGWLVLIPLMLIGGGAGSTAGGIKQYRIVVLLKALWWEMRRLLLPQQVVTEPSVWQVDKQHFLGDRQIRQVGLLIFLHLTLFLLGAIVLTGHGYGIAESLFEFASTISTVGLSVGVTSATAPPGVLWTQIAGMFLGRLEFFAVFIGVAKVVQDIRAFLNA